MEDRILQGTGSRMHCKACAALGSQELGPWREGLAGGVSQSLWRHLEMGAISA